MRIRTFHYLLVVLLLTGAACKRKEASNKILPGIPVQTEQTITPAQAAQQFFLVIQDMMRVMVPVVNRLIIPNSAYPELSGSGPDYTFQLQGNHYGTANFTIGFRDIGNGVIDPIAINSSSATLNSVVVSVTGNSELFSYTENLAITLTVAGDVFTDKRLTGTSNWTGSGYTIVYTCDSPGPRGTFEGMFDGQCSSTGSGGPGNQNTTTTLIFSNDHNADGTITWEGNEGSLHFDTEGDGFVITGESRLLME